MNIQSKSFQRNFTRVSFMKMSKTFFKRSEIFQHQPQYSLLHKETGERQDIPQEGGFGCLELVVYGIRMLVEQFLE